MECREDQERIKTDEDNSMTVTYKMKKKVSYISKFKIGLSN